MSESRPWWLAADAEDDPGLEGKVAIVAGASGHGDGITNGRAAAIGLARAGAKVVCVGRRREQVERTAEMINDIGGVALAVSGDVTLEADCERIVSATIERYGRLDLLDNNVGVGLRGTVVTVPVADWRSLWQTNVESVISMSRKAIPAMIETAGGGAIVNIGSLRAIRPHDNSPYSATKGAVMALTRAMAVDHGPDHIRVNCIVLGPVFTSTVEAGIPPSRRELRKNASVLQVEGTAWDNANLVRFLLSEHARYITGQCIVLDGGVSVLSPRR